MYSSKSPKQSSLVNSDFKHMGLYSAEIQTNSKCPKSVLIWISGVHCMYFIFFRIYDIDNDGFISNGELFQVLKMMVGSNLKDTQLQQIVDKTILIADKVSV